jgi:hypothetical protein
MQRELILKLLKYERDEVAKFPYQKRWQDAGTMFGGYIQELLLYIEKWYPTLFGEESPFYFERTDRGFPAYEEAIKKCTEHTHNGQVIRIFGQSDGIIIHRKTGTRIILEIKSKQTTYSSTGYYKLKEPSSDHSRQVVAYSLQHGVDHAIVLYGNLSKKSWMMTEEEVEKYPDLRAFDIAITDEDRLSLLDYFAEVLELADKKQLPKVDLDRWTFCNFKRAIIGTLTEEEYNEIKHQVKLVLKSGLPDYKKNEYLNILEFIDEVR